MNNSLLANRVLCVGLRTSCLGTSMQDNSVTDDILARYGAQRGKLRATKTILAEAIKPFRQLRNEARKYFNSVTLPGISDDLRITTPHRLPDLQRKVQEFKDRDAALLAILRPSYQDEIDKDRLSLGGAFDSDLYPKLEDLGKFFRLDLATMDLPAGDYARIEGLTASVQLEMREQHRAMLERVAREARNEVMGHLTKLIQHVADKLSDTSAKKFHESTFDNLKEYLAMVPDLNITNDPALEAMRKEATERLNYSMRVVKDSALLRETAAAAAKEIVGKFGSITSGRKLVA